jgi:hypothetical protein
MNKRMTFFVLAAGAAGAMLLTACGQQAGSTTGAKDAPGTSVKVDSVARGGSDLEPVNCGEVQVNGAAHTLVADPTRGGIVGCTQAFNTLDEYLAIPVEERNATLDSLPVSDGWSCVTDDGEFASVGCVKGERVDDDYEFAFHTEPADAVEPMEPVNCGEIAVTNTITHNLIADPTRGGIVGCTEAFTIIDEYLAIPVEERNASFENLPVSNGWSCGTDDGESWSFYCVKGERVNDNYEFAFHTEPV